MGALEIRIILNGILTLGFIIGAISLYFQKKNGITKAMATFTLFAAFHVGMLIIVGLIDVTRPENLVTLQFERYAWNWVSFGWILSGLYLAYKLIKEKDDE